MFEEFSAGYYVGRLYVNGHEGEHAVMDREQHEAANEQVYATGADIERLDHPLVMKVDERHFPVLGADDVPSDTIAVPETILETTRIDNPPTVEDVLVVKAERALQLLEWATPFTVQKPEST